jgi:hypothetical protein
MSEAWSPIPEAHALREWGLAEIVSPTAPLGQMRELEPLRARVRAAGRATLTEEDWQILERGARATRSPMIDPLLLLRPAWYEGEVAVANLFDARIIAYQPFVEKAPSRRLDDLCGQPQAPSAEFNRAVMTARPIVLGSSLSGPWCLVEGYRRCCRAIRDHRVGRFDGQPMPVIAGVTSRATEWSWWR